MAGFVVLLVVSVSMTVLALTSHPVPPPPPAPINNPSPAPTKTPDLVWIDAKTAPWTVSGGPAEFFDLDGRQWMRNGLMTDGGKGWLGPRNGGSPQWVSFLTDAPRVEPVYLALNGRIRHMVDGQWVNQVTSLKVGTNGGYMQAIVLEGPRAMHRVDLRMDEAPIGGIAIPPGYKVEPAPVGYVSANLGDSFSESNMSLPMSETDRMEGQIYTMARALGIERDVINDAIGGRSYTNPGPLKKTFMDSINTDFAALPPEMSPRFFTIWGGYNDGKATTQQLYDGALATYATIGAKYPGVPIFVVFNGDRPEPAISTETQQKKLRDTIKSAALAAPNVGAFIDGVAGTWYPGQLSKSAGPSTPPQPWLTQENSSQMTGSDKIHGTPAYYQKVGPTVAAAILEASGGNLP